jgi:hypothetical protein
LVVAGYSEQIENSATEMLERLEPLRVAAIGEAENLGHAVTQLVSKHTDHHHQPINVPTTGAQAFLMYYT